MTSWELALECRDAIHRARGTMFKATILIVGKGTLFPHGGGPKPIKMLCANRAGEKVWLYSALDVLAALCAAGVVEYELFEDGVKITRVEQKQ